MIYNILSLTHRKINIDKGQIKKFFFFTEVVTQKCRFDFYRNIKLEPYFLVIAAGTFTKRKLHFAAGFLREMANVRNLNRKKNIHMLLHSIRLPINYIMVPKTVE